MGRATTWMATTALFFAFATAFAADRGSREGRGRGSSAADNPQPIHLQPSENKGRAGTYTVKSSVADYSYHVCVPKTYSETNPAGLHLFFSGQGGCATNEDFSRWSQYFLGKHNLIGINMKYPDGDNGKDTAGKVAAAREALAQVIADYKIVAGRGTVGCFSGGGLPLGLFVRTCAKERGPDWPFCEVALYSANFRQPAKPPVLGMNWFIGVGTKEWNLANLGATQTGRMADRFADASGKDKGCPDAYCKVLDRGHEVAEADVAEASAMFPRAELGFAPFLYEADYTEPQLAPIVKNANSLVLGPSVRSLQALAARTDLKPELKVKVTTLQEKLDRRVEAILALMKQLAQDDWVLCQYYGGVFSLQLTSHPREKELAAILAGARKEKGFAPANLAFEEFAKGYKDLFKDGKLAPGKKEYLEQLIPKVGGSSFVGRMAAEYLKLPQ